jgi:hypothetical protein
MLAEIFKRLFASDMNIIGSSILPTGSIVYPIGGIFKSVKWQVTCLSLHQSLVCIALSTWCLVSLKQYFNTGCRICHFAHSLQSSYQHSIASGYCTHHAIGNVDFFQEPWLRTSLIAIIFCWS